MALIKLAREAKGYTYTWSATNFEYSTIESPSFKIGPDVTCEVEWFIQMELVESTGYFKISLYSKSDSSKPPFEMHIIFSIVTKYGYEAYEQERHVSYQYGQAERTFQKFVKKDFCFDEKNGLLKDGKLTIRCRLYFFSKDYKTLRIPHRNLEFADFEKLLESKAHSDVRLVVQDEEFHVHKCILAARSPVFAAMFEHDMRENNENVVKIADIKVEVMRELLRFMYANKVDNTSTNVKDLLAAADKYEIEELKIMCEDVILDTLDVNNLGGLLAFADMYKASKLKTKMVEFIKWNKNRIDKETLLEETKLVTFSILDFIDHL